MSNVVIKKRYAAYNVDSFNRTAVGTADMENGCVFKLVKYSETEGEEMVWQAEQAAATDTGLWMATSPEVVVTKDGGLEFKGIVVDPRNFTNHRGAPIDAILLQYGDIIEMTGDGISDISTADYLVPSASNFKLEKAVAAGEGLTLQKIGTGVLSIGVTGGFGAKAIPTYKFQVIKN